MDAGGSPDSGEVGGAGRMAEPGVILPGSPVRDSAAFVIGFRMFFVHEREDTLVLAQCFPEYWFRYGDALQIRNAPTYFGLVSYSVKTVERESILILDTPAMPPGGFVLKPLVPSYSPTLEIDGRKIRGDLNFERKQELFIPPGSFIVKVQW